ncbi:MAG: hypothetical protein IJK87_14760 [Prevotella sp.]|nr:hypothetical protein [Prevotella sp.]
MRRWIFAWVMLLGVSQLFGQPINRKEVVRRHNPHVTTMDKLASLSVGNGHFACTVDATGMQTFPEEYADGVPLGTMSDWGWHYSKPMSSFDFEDVLVERDFGRGHKELYAAQFKEPGRQKEAENYYRANPHRLHLGTIGLDLDDMDLVKDIDQTLDLWTGKIDSRFTYNGQKYHVETVCDPRARVNTVSWRITSDGPISVIIRFPEPTGKHTDDGCDWQTDISDYITFTKNLRDRIVEVERYPKGFGTYYMSVSWMGNAKVSFPKTKSIKLKSSTGTLDFSCEFSSDRTRRITMEPFSEHAIRAAQSWNNYWNTGGIVDFSHVTDARAAELERRVILSRYLMLVNDAGDTPPQETGLTYNSWFGKFHLEMEWWHQAQFALWGNPYLLARTFLWYQQMMPVAKQIAERQGFDGIRWMKMTDPSGMEAPSNVGSYLIWQQPHPIHLLELLYRTQVLEDSIANDKLLPSERKKRKDLGLKIIEAFDSVVYKTADFMASFATYDEANDRYVLKGCIPAQETLKADSTVNPPFELSYWLWGLETAQKWRERENLKRNPLWDDIIQKLSPLAYNEDSLYLAAETAPQTYRDIRFTSDHPAVLGAVGILPQSRLVNDTIMRKTLDWVWDKWNWDKTWGWDFPMVAMCAARLGDPERAVDALLMPKRTNTYLVNGHNYQDSRLRCYLPGNGGLLTAVAMMCAGWDGSKGKNPGFPEDWDVRWEGLMPLP